MLYAHIRRADGEPERRQTLADHSRKAAAIGGESGGKIGLGSLTALAALLHDGGKAKAEFQAYLLEPDEQKQRALRGRINHAAAGARYLWEAAALSDGMPLSQFCRQLAALCMVSHHGGLADCLSPSGEDGLSPRLYPEKESGYAESVQAFFSECLEEESLPPRIAEALAETEALYNRIRTVCADLPPLSPSFFAGLAARFLFSCLIDADRYDTFCFEAGIEPAPPASHAELWPVLCTRLESRLAAFPKTREIDRLRGKIADSCLEAAAFSPGVYRLHVPTGAGKTMSSLRFALHHARLHHMDRVVYVIPYTTIIDQTAKDVRETLQCGEAILEHHANLIPDEKEDGERRRLFTERWDAPIILTTMVQFLNTLFAGGTQSARRMHNLAHAVLVFDEIQAIPVRCIHLFNLAVMFLTRVCGATVLLCTATQPPLDAVPLPLRYASPADIVPDYEAHFARFRRTVLHDVRRHGSFDTGELAAFIGGVDAPSLLCVLNTRGAARRLYTVMASACDEKKTRLFYLSNDLCPAHRLKVLDDVETALEERRGRVVVISTQLIEAGINLSVSCVVRSLAGLDNIAQAAGRCNRHGEDACRPVYIVENRDENLDRLPEIRQAQIACRVVLDEFAADPAAFDGDLLSPKALRRYYDLYQYARREEMSYAVASHCPTDLVTLLSQNSPGVREAAKKRMPPRPLNQAFGTAGDVFRVIDEDTTAVLVPYDEDAKALLVRLEEGGDPRQTAALLRRAQRYAVGVYPPVRAALEREKALRALPCGVLVLEEGYYRSDTGITTERAPLPLLHY